MANGPGITIPQIDFATLNHNGIEVGSYFIGFNTNAGGKLSKMDHLGNITLIEDDGGDQPTPNYTYEIGQYVASRGGVIAHRWLSTTALGSPETGAFQNYLVVDTQDLSSGAKWASSNADISSVESRWDGLTNTTNLIIAGSGSGITDGTAAVLCDASTNGGQNDWYLPAIDELALIQKNLWDINQGILSSAGNEIIISPYWSSTEYSFNTAWYWSFIVDGTGQTTKSITFNVRAVRKFSI
jgi:hypothetical protein